MKAVVFILALVCVGCAGIAPDITTKYDKFQDQTTVHLSENRNIVDGGMMSATTAAFDLMMIKKAGIKYYSLVIVLRSKNWYFITKERSLYLIVDGKRWDPMNANSVVRDVQSFITGATIREAAFYDITDDQLAAFSAAKTIEFKLIGEKGSAECALVPANLNLIKSFAAQTK